MKWFPHFFHSWRRVSAKKVTLEMTSPLFGGDWEEEAVIVIERCGKCGEERAFMSHIDGRSVKIAVEVARL